MPRKQTAELKQAAASAIRDARSSAAVSQVELSNRLQVSQPLVSSWECGRVTVGIDDVLNIEAALGLSRGSLLLQIVEKRTV